MLCPQQHRTGIVIPTDAESFAKVLCSHCQSNVVRVDFATTALLHLIAEDPNPFGNGTTIKNCFEALKKCISDDFEALSFEDFNALCVYTESLSFKMKIKAIAA